MPRQKKKSTLTAKEIIAVLRNERAALKRKYGVEKIALFGSFLKGKAHTNSDLDILVSFSNPTFDNYMDLKDYLEKLFKRKVDLITEASLKPALQYVKAEAAYVR